MNININQKLINGVTEIDYSHIYKTKTHQLYTDIILPRHYRLFDKNEHMLQQ